MNPRTLAMFDDGSELPLFTNTPVPCSDPEHKTKMQPAGQPLLLEPSCRFCMDGGYLVINGERKRCWCNQA